jgi:hypothetical protein
MTRVVHVIGNGDKAALYKPAKGIKITCNLPPFAVEGAYATCIVDFKMMRAMAEGSVFPPGDWILGFRPKKFLEMNPSLRLKWVNHIKEFYTELPDYVANYTDFNCGHMATHYAANKIKGTEIHLYGFDSMFDPNLRSCTDLYLNSDRSETNNHRLANNWRPVWSNMFKEFSDTQFVLHHNHDKIRFPVPKNVEIVTK